MWRIQLLFLCSKIITLNIFEDICMSEISEPFLERRFRQWPQRSNKICTRPWLLFSHHPCSLPYTPKISKWGRWGEEGWRRRRGRGQRFPFLIYFYSCWNEGFYLWLKMQTVEDAKTAFDAKSALQQRYDDRHRRRHEERKKVLKNRVAPAYNQPQRSFYFRGIHFNLTNALANARKVDGTKLFECNDRWCYWCWLGPELLFIKS